MFCLLGQKLYAGSWGRSIVVHIQKPAIGPKVYYLVVEGLLVLDFLKIILLDFLHFWLALAVTVAPSADKSHGKTL